MRRRLDLLAEHRVRLPREEALSELRDDVVRAAYVEGDFEGDFVLTGGLRRSYYFDKYLFETRPAILRRLGRFLADLVPRDTGGWPLRHSEPWPSALPSRWSWACRS
jgi:hypothetical protein